MELENRSISNKIILIIIMFISSFAFCGDSDEVKTEYIKDNFPYYVMIPSEIKAESGIATRVSIDGEPNDYTGSTINFKNGCSVNIGQIVKHIIKDSSKIIYINSKVFTNDKVTTQTHIFDLNTKMENYSFVHSLEDYISSKDLNKLSKSISSFYQLFSIIVIQPIDSNLKDDEWIMVSEIYTTKQTHTLTIYFINGQTRMTIE